MKYAILNNVKNLAQPKLKGVCPFCYKNVVAKCGNKVVWHWAHESKKHCDLWWEPETKWHRDWKNLYPDSWQEVLLFDEENNERHIADIKTSTGLVIEFQNSPLQGSELSQRESFYKNIIWVVNGEKFIRNFHILHELPDPHCEMFRDIVFFPRKYSHNGKLFYKKSENSSNDFMVQVHSVAEIQTEIIQNYIGHHLFDWIKPRTVWYESRAVVYIDFGDEFLWRLGIYDEKGLRFVQAVSKVQFLKDTGGLGFQDYDKSVLGKVEK